MQIERNHTKESSAVTFNVFINNIKMYELYDSGKIDVDCPKDDFTIQVKTNSVEKSKMYAVKLCHGIRLIVFINPFIRLIHILLPLLIAVVFIVGIAIKNYWLLPAITVPIIVIYYFIFYKVLSKDYIRMKAFNEDGDEVLMEEITEGE